MTYRLEFHEDALKEWQKLDGSLKQQFKDKLAERLQNPHITKSRLHGKDMQSTYKIKLRDVGYRLVYEVNDQTVTVLLPGGAQKYGLIEDIEPDADGCVHAPVGPGLGAKIDFDLIKKKYVAVL